MGAAFFLFFMILLLFLGIVAVIIGIIIGRINKKNPKTAVKVIAVITKIVGVFLCLIPLLFVSFIGIANLSQNQYEKSLEAATSRRNYDQVLQLLASGENPDKCRNTYTPLMHACTGSGGYDIAKLLLEYGADVNAQYRGYADGKEKGYTALLYASGSGDEKLITLLLDNGAEINLQAADGRSALMQAGYYENPALVVLLVNKGADVNATDKAGKSALAHALDSLFAPNYTIIEYLLENGANAGIQTADGKSLLDLLEAGKEKCRETDYQRIKQLLAAHITDN